MTALAGGQYNHRPHAQMVDEGKLGKKSGQGFYRWQDGKKVV